MLPANSRANRRGVPDGFQPLHIDIAEFIEKRDGYMPAGDIHSKTVRRTTIAAGVGAGERSVAFVHRRCQLFVLLMLSSVTPQA